VKLSLHEGNPSRSIARSAPAGGRRDRAGDQGPDRLHFSYKPAHAVERSGGGAPPVPPPRQAAGTRNRGHDAKDPASYVERAKD